MEPLRSYQRKRLTFLGKITFRVIIIVLVSWFIWRSVDQALDDLSAQQQVLQTDLADLQAKLEALQNDPLASPTAIKNLHQQKNGLSFQQFSIGQIRWQWLVAAGALYLVGMIPSWLFWHRCLLAMHQKPTLWESFCAFQMSHLGKYVPGKAMVVVLRTSSIRSDRVDTTIAATSVFVETLTMMSVGAMLAATLIFCLFRDQTMLLAVAIGLALCAGIPTLPPIFRRIVMLLQVKRVNPAIETALHGLNYRLMLSGWTTLVIGWGVMGLSLWATLLAIPGTNVSPADFPLLLTCVTLAVVAGFVSMLPGGFLVREAVVLTLLAPNAQIGRVAAITSAILLRLSWLAAELAIVAILYIVRIVTCSASQLNPENSNIKHKQ